MPLTSYMKTWLWWEIQFILVLHGRICHLINVKCLLILNDIRSIIFFILFCLCRWSSGWSQPRRRLRSSTRSCRAACRVHQGWRLKKEWYWKGFKISKWSFAVLTFFVSCQKKLPLMLLSVSMAESLKDFDAVSSIRWQVWSSPFIQPPIHLSVT